MPQQSTVYLAEKTQVYFSPALNTIAYLVSGNELASFVLVYSGKLICFCCDYHTFNKKECVDQISVLVFYW